MQEVIAELNRLGPDTAAHRPDYRSSGVLDNLTIVAQTPQQSSRSHKTSYPGTDTFSGYRVGSYNFIAMGSLMSEVSGYYTYNPCVLSHEFLHTLGLPDLYRLDDSSGIPVGRWDIMASEGFFHQYPLSYMRHTLGWIPLPEITQASPGTYTVNCTSLDTGTVAYKIVSPLSSSEYFVVEYRKQNTTYITNDTFGFERIIPGTGLLVYRVNESVEHKTNIAGENYIYVFRPNPTSINGATEDYTGAALNPDEGETSFGSTDLNRSFQENTLYFSDGSNSGIALSNIAYSADGNAMSFDVSFADYSALELWDEIPLGGTVSIAGAPSAAVDAAGNAYVAYAASGSVVEVKKYDGLSWSAQGGALSGALDPVLAIHGGSVYLGCFAGNKPTVYRLQNGAWSQVFQDSSAANAQNLGLFSDSGNLYCYYVSGGAKLSIYSVLNKQLVSNSLSAGYLANPSVCRYNGAFYALYSDFYAGSGANNATLARLASGGAWETVTTFGVAQSKFHELAVNGATLCAFAGNDSGTYLYAESTGGEFSQESVSGIPSNLAGLRMISSDGTYLGVVDGVSRQAKILSRGSGGFTQLGSAVSANVSALAFAAGGGKIYAAVMTTDNALGVRTKAAPPAAPTPTPEPTPDPGQTPEPTPIVSADNLSVTLRPPSSFQNAVIWFDGVAVDATASGGAYTAEAPNSGAKIATMYEYNAKGVATGMYVWKLTFENHGFRVEALPLLEDLLSYHGFAIRVKGYSGIRFKSGILPGTRATLLSSAGLGGFRLVEYGTVVMRASNLSSYPFVKGGQKTSFGKAYWTDSSGAHDAIFETKDGRLRFTSVLTNIPAADYTTDYAFRAYILLEKDGATYIVYGPPVSRSIYTVAKQVMAAGEFAQGTVQYAFVENIIRVSEGGS